VVGAPVDIYGRNLAGPGFPDVRFGDSDWNSLIVTEFDPLHIRAYVPDDATTGRVRVRTASGTAVSSTDFIIGSGGLVLFDWEVHQGLPSYPRVAGKSTVVHHFAEWGATVIDADELVREVQQPGTDTLHAIVRHFGDQVLHADGSLNRQALRRVVMGDDEARSELNAIVHPVVTQRREELARESDLPPEKVQEILSIAREPVSLEMPVGEEEDSTIASFIADGQTSTS